MTLLRQLIYYLKRRTQRLPRLYASIYFCLTWNWDYFQQLMQRSQYSCRFGGMWSDRRDFEARLREKLSRNQVSDSHIPALRQWRSEGFVVLPGAISYAAIDRLLAELDTLPQSFPHGLRITGGGSHTSRLYRPESIKPHDSIRIVDCYFYSTAARLVLFDGAILDFLKIVLEAEPILT